jgi:tetratricopeptide (TPR) repeat protein
LGRHDALAIALLVVVPLALYMPILDGPFLWDDRSLIVDELLTSGGTVSIADVFRRPFWRETAGHASYRGFYRPVTATSYVVDARLHGANPAGFHLTNVLLHACTVVAAYLLFRSLRATPVASGLAAGLFALAPRLAECVAWISGRTDILAALLGTVSLLIYPLPSRGPSARAGPRAILGALLLLASVLAKEVGFAFFAIAILDELQHAIFVSKSSQRATAVRVGGVVVGMLGYFALRTSALAEAPPGQYDYVGSRAATILEALGTYAWMVVDFVEPRTQIGFLRIRTPALVVVGVVVALGLLATAIVYSRRAWLRRRTGVVPLGPDGLLLMLAAAALFPVLHIAPLAVTVVAADRFLYTVLLALFGAAAVWSSALQRKTLVRVVAAGGLAALVASGAALTRRVSDFRSEVAFWADAARTSHPANPLPLGELANVYFRAQSNETALGLYVAFLERYPREAHTSAPYLDGVGNVANVLSRQGRYTDALQVRTWIATKRFANAADTFQTGLVHLHRGDLDNAERAFDRALAQFADYPDAIRMKELMPSLRSQQSRVLKGIATPFEAAGYLARIGARAEACRLFAELVTRDDIALEQRNDAAAYLAEFADYKAAEAALRHRQWIVPTVVARMHDRLQFETSSASLAPWVASQARPLVLERLTR